MGLRIREDYRNISGPEKSAILLMSLGEDQAGKLFALLDDEEIKEISQVMAGLGTVSSNIVERLFVEFAESVSSTGSLVGSMDSTQRLLAKFWVKIVLTMSWKKSEVLQVARCGISWPM